MGKTEVGREALFFRAFVNTNRKFRFQFDVKTHNYFIKSFCLLYELEKEREKRDDIYVIASFIVAASFPGRVESFSGNGLRRLPAKKQPWVCYFISLYIDNNRTKHLPPFSGAVCVYTSALIRWNAASHVIDGSASHQLTNKMSKLRTQTRFTRAKRENPQCKYLHCKSNVISLEFHIVCGCVSGTESLSNSLRSVSSQK